MLQRVITVHNKAGIHCRPSSVILNTILQEFSDHEFHIETPDGHEAELNSILSLISLGLTLGSTAELTVSGPREAEAIQKIGDLFEHEFDFPPR